MSDRLATAMYDPFLFGTTIVQTVNDHHVHLSTASYADLDNVAKFAAHHAFKVKQSTGVITSKADSGEGSEALDAMRERFKAAMAAVLNCHVQGKGVEGAILKIEYRGEIVAVMALSLAVLQPDGARRGRLVDAWSRNEQSELAGGRHPWIFPGAAHMEALEGLIRIDCNDSREFINVPYLFVPLEAGHLARACVSALADVVVAPPGARRQQQEDCRPYRIYGRFCPSPVGGRGAEEAFEDALTHTLRTL
ncbi:hypothetical protein F5X97DRAFT_338486 [Nemania serpens]|nr:hypothetical protein F5X97DRAFT_338486 [Nemania serpens]